MDRLDDVNEKRLQAQAGLEAIDVYNQCLASVDARQDVRAILLAIADQLPSSDAVSVIQDLIQNEAEELDVLALCGPAPDPPSD